VSSVASAPGKVLLTGGYLVLERPNAGLVLSTNARFYAIVKPFHDDVKPESWAWVCVLFFVLLPVHLVFSQSWHQCAELQLIGYGELYAELVDFLFIQLKGYVGGKKEGKLVISFLFCMKMMSFMLSTFSKCSLC